MSPESSGSHVLTMRVIERKECNVFLPRILCPSLPVLVFDIMSSSFVVLSERKSHVFIQRARTEMSAVHTLQYGEK